MYLFQSRAGAKPRPPRSATVAKHERRPNPEGDHNLHLDERFNMGFSRTLALSTDDTVRSVLATEVVMWSPVYCNARDAVSVAGMEEQAIQAQEVKEDGKILLDPPIKEPDPDDIWTPAGEDYARHSATLSVERDLHPAVVFAPSLTQSLAKIMGFLYNSSLDFNVRGHGFRSPLFSTVLINILKFKAFQHDPVKNLASVGHWSDVVRGH
ncbi:hypothetical protein BDV27DRAFT_158785 [Aspergillus caelatus]|uniref:Uncharacterized protein n=1 Tax=Aspergillus caelatus TaxID=61420 RepID=A0A5N7A0S0_9EURO|nr:uncharacterized protein BDV27DRAFT_158785 [Aspergillus caelatus]KAE8363464.1 hypothetical protein BDV27DRAFT_158785 [Aspergillus caelatus]